MGLVHHEVRLPRAAPLLACGWIGDGGGARVLPDACVDVVLSAGRLVVAGPATMAVEVAPTPGHHRCGVRFRVGAAGAGLGLPVDELLDVDVELEDLWGAGGRRPSEQVAGQPEATTALSVLVRGLARPRAEIDTIARQAALLVRGRGVADIAGELGLSERHLRRRVQRSVGYGPATLARVLRLQRFLGAAGLSPGLSLSHLAAAAGYADQAHLSRDCRALTGLTPSALRATGARPAGEAMSGSFKTPTRSRATVQR